MDFEDGLRIAARSSLMGNLCTPLGSLHHAMSDRGDSVSSPSQTAAPI